MTDVGDFIDPLASLPPRARILVGMSGGVDSSVAAAVLAARGFDVVGVSLHLWEEPAGASPSRCCAPEDLDDARASAAAIGVPHFVFDRQESFAADVVEPFVDAYLRGVTPSPCVACNREVKIASFVELCDRLGAAAFATGHYARAIRVRRDDGSERPALFRARDLGKDQSYFLHGIGPRALAKLLTPLGDLQKSEVRAIARARGLPNADKPDSEDLCFVAGDHAGFVAKRAGDRVRPGPIVDAEGRTVGQHDGVHRFTIGQRKGLGIALGKPAFVASIDAESATVYLGAAESLAGHAALVANVAWTSDAWSEGAPASVAPRRVRARVRYRHDGADATLTQHAPNVVRLRFDEPVRAITPGQTCVFYDGDEVVGGGTIARALADDELVAASLSVGL